MNAIDTPRCPPELSKKLASFLHAKWDGLPATPALEKVIEEVASAAYSQIQFPMVDSKTSLRMSTILSNAIKARSAHLAALPESAACSAVAQSADLFDAVKQKLTDYMVALFGVQQEAANAWRYEDGANRVANRVFRAIDGLSSAKPKGWAEFKVGYTDFDGQAEYESASDLKLLGHIDDDRSVADDFVHRVALPYVAYDEIVQGRKAARMLVSGLFSLFLTRMCREECESMARSLEEAINSAPAELVFEYALQFSHPSLQAVADAVNDKPSTNLRELYESSVVSIRQFQALPIEEQERIKAENKAAIAKRLSDFLRVDKA